MTRVPAFVLPFPNIAAVNAIVGAALKGEEKHTKLLIPAKVVVIEFVLHDSWIVGNVKPSPSFCRKERW